jgi:hypothetical protein
MLVPMTDAPSNDEPNQPGWAAPGDLGAQLPPPPPPHDPTLPPGVQGQPQQFGYGYGYAAQRSTNGLAIAALVCGIVGILILNVILGPLAFIFGLVSRNQIKRAGGRQKGEGMAIAGIVLGPIDLVLGILVLNATL